MLKREYRKICYFFSANKKEMTKKDKDGNDKQNKVY